MVCNKNSRCRHLCSASARSSETIDARRTPLVKKGRFIARYLQSNARTYCTARGEIKRDAVA